VGGRQQEEAAGGGGMMGGMGAQVEEKLRGIEQRLPAQMKRWLEAVPFPQKIKDALARLQLADGSAGLESDPEDGVPREVVSEET